MRRIPTGLRNRMDAKPEYHRCMLTGMAHEKIDWHHAFLYAGRQVNEEWCIIPLLHTDPTTQKPTYSNYYPGGIAASDITAFIVDDPDAVFLMDADATFTRADLYKNYSVTNTTGVTQTGISKQQLDVSVSGVASTFAVQAIDISQDPENSDTSSANANILVRINNHFYRSGTGIA